VLKEAQMWRDVWMFGVTVSGHPYHLPVPVAACHVCTVPQGMVSPSVSPPHPGSWRARSRAFTRCPCRQYASPSQVIDPLAWWSIRNWCWCWAACSKSGMAAAGSPFSRGVPAPDLRPDGEPGGGSSGGCRRPPRSPATADRAAVACRGSCCPSCAGILGGR
jgi:hypothetical protein